MVLKPKDLPFDPGFEVEMSGWTLGMALKLGLASNPQVSEFSRLPDETRPHCAYLADPEFLADFQSLGRQMAPRPAAHNLRGMVKRNLMKDLAPDSLPAPKVYLHTAQALLRARWVIRNHDRGHAFPLEIDRLIDEVAPGGDPERQLRALVAWKREAADSSGGGRIPVLDDWLRHEWMAIEADILTIPDAHIPHETVEAMWMRAYERDLVARPDPEMETTNGIGCPAPI